MDLKEKRHEIYTLIEKEIGTIRPEILGVLSKKIKEYSKLHSEKILKELIELKNKKALIKKPENVVLKPIKKPVIGYDPNYFNSDFLKK